MGKGFCYSLAAILLASTAWASDGSFDAQAAAEALDTSQGSPAISPAEAFTRRQAVLRNFNVPDEADPQPGFTSYQSMQTPDGFQALLPFFDLGSEILQFSNVQNSQLNVYQDPGSRQIQDFTVSFRSSVQPAPEENFEKRLKAARENTSDHPLQGLRIALDPGHMGGAHWDQITGKWTQDTDGRKLSEGIINLQTALLLEQQLVALGAEVMLSHRDLKPVTDADFDHFDLQTEARQSLRERSLSSWFTQLLAVAPAGPALYDAFSKSPWFQKVFSENQRGVYFDDLDLHARVDKIKAFQPDLVLIIHFDADTHAVSSSPAFSHDATKAYVPGAFSPFALASRDDRAQMVLHLLDESAWRASVAMAHEVVSSLSTNLHIPLSRLVFGGMKRIEPGIFSRNLVLLKAHQPAAMVYVECAFYNDQGEFDAISDATHPMVIDGESHPYSDRIQLVADSLKQGILQFVKKGF